MTEAGRRPPSRTVRSGTRGPVPTSRPRPRKAKRRALRLPVGSPARRLTVLMVAIAIVMSVLGGRALQLQGIEASSYAAAAAKQMTLTKKIMPFRGTITDRNGQVLSVSEPAVNVIADPSRIRTNGMLDRSMSARDKAKAAAGPGVIAGVLAAYLGGDAVRYEEALSRQATAADGTTKMMQYVIVARSVPSFTYLQIQENLSELGYVGLASESAPIRSYPNGSLAANVLGFVNQEGAGAGGLEFELNSNLSGIEGREIYQTSPNGKIPTGANVLTPAQDGIDYELTIDAGLQYMLERRLQEAVDASRAVSGMGVVLNVKTGEVLSMANYPSYDSNAPGIAAAENLGNRVVTDAYEPGSVQKVLTMAMLADQGLVTGDTRLVVPPSIRSADRQITDAFTHGTINLTARGVIANSSNIGTVMLARKSAKAPIADYLKAFGLGARTSLGLPGEAVGSIPGPDMSDLTRDQIAFGQGLSVTAIQEAAAVAAIVNGGVYNSPTIIKAAMTRDGKAVEVPLTTSRRVISPEASASVLDMMEAVVASKTGVNRFPIEGYRTAAKSGTAERIDPKCGCYSGGYVSSFVGVGPVEDPTLLVYIVIDRPQGDRVQGSQVAAPVYKDVMKLALPRYGVRVSTTPPSNAPIDWH